MSSQAITNFEVGESRLMLYPFGITAIANKVDVIVSSDDELLSAGGGVSQALRYAAGESPFKEGRAKLEALRRRVSSVAPGTVVFTSAGELPCKFLAHFITISRTARLSKATLCAGIIECFAQAASLGATSLALPALGTGAGQFSPGEAAEIMVGMVAKYFRTGTTPIKTVYFSVPHDVVRQEFDRQFTRLKMSEDDDMNRSDRAIMFTDIVGSTAFFDKMGDDAGLKLLEDHNRIVLPLISKSDGKTIKTIGDGVLAAFWEPDRACACAIDVLHSLEQYNSEVDSTWRIILRIGIHYGRVLSKTGDVFGDVVNSAQRIQSEARPASALISESVLLNLDRRGWSVGAPRECRLKGKELPMRVYPLLARAV